MSKENMWLVKLLPALIFAIISLVCIMAGWQIGTLGWLGLRHTGDYVNEGGIRGGLLGLIFGSFLSFGSFGITTGWIWRQRYPNLRLKHFLLLTLGWMVIPIFILSFMLWFGSGLL